MTNLGAMTNDELASLIRDALLEGESRLQAAGLHRILRRVRIAHAYLHDAGGDLADDGSVSPMSIGGNK